MNFIKYFFTFVFFSIYSSFVFAENIKIKLLLDWFVNPDHGPIIIANEKGYFKKLGLDVEIISPANPSDPPKLLAAGEADIAISYQPQLHLQTHQGLPLVRVGTLIATPLNCLLVMKDGPIKNLSDLKGKRIGYSIAGIEKALINSILAKGSVKQEEIELINVNWSLSPSLLSGQVDAVLGAFRNFELNQLEIEGKQGKCFYLEEEGIPVYDELIFIANRNNYNKDNISKFLEAVEMATIFIINHPETSWNIFSSTSSELNDELNYKAWKDTLPRLALRPSALDYKRYKRFEYYLYNAKLIDSIFPVHQFAIDVHSEE